MATMRKILLSVFLLMLIQSIQPANAQSCSSITIEADGRINEEYLNRPTFNDLDTPPRILSRGAIEQIFWNESSDCLLVETNTGLWVYDSDDISQAPQLLANTDEDVHFLASPRGSIKTTSNVYTLSNDGELMVRVVGSSVCCASYIELVETDNFNVVAKSEAVNRMGFLSFALSEDKQKIYGISMYGMIYAWLRNGDVLEREFMIGEPRRLRNVYDYGFDATGYYPFILGNHEIYLGQLDGSIQVWDLASETLVATWRGHIGAITQLIISPAEQLIASGSQDGSVRIWDIATGATVNLIQSMENHAAPVTGLVFSPDGQELIVGDFFGAIRKWSVHTSYSQILYSTDNALEDLVYSPDGRHLALAQQSGQITVLNSENYRIESQFAAHSGAVNSLDFSADGTVLASGGDDSTVKLWNLETGAALAVFEDALWPVRQVLHQTLAISGSGLSLPNAAESLGKFFSISWDGIFRLHDPNINYSRGDIAIAETYAESIAISPNGRLMAIGAWDGSVRIWLESNGYFERSFITVTDARSRINALAFSPDNRSLAAGSEDGGIYLWDVSSPATPFIGRLQGDLNGLNDLAFTSNGQVLVGAGADLWLWDAQSYQELSILRGHQEEINAVALNPLGGIVSASDDGTVRLWNIVDAIPLSTSHHFGLIGEEYRNDENGNLVGVNAIGNNIFSWNAKTGASLGMIRSAGNSQGNASLERFAVAPDASYLISIYDFQSSIELLEPQTGFVIPRWFADNLSSHDFQVQISSDGQWIAARGYNNITIWDVNTGTPIAIKGTLAESHERFFFVDGTNYLYVLDGTLNQFVIWDFINNLDMMTLAQAPIASYDGRLFFNAGTEIDLRSRTETASNFLIHRAISYSMDGPNVIVSRNGQFLAAAGYEWWAVWDIQSGELLVDMTGTLWELPMLISFSADSRYLYMNSHGILLAWDMEDFQ